MTESLHWEAVERKAAYILAGIAASEFVWVYFNIIGRQAKFWRYIGASSPARAGIFSWLLGLSVAAAFILYSLQYHPSDRRCLRFLD